MTKMLFDTIMITWVISALGHKMADYFTRKAAFVQVNNEKE